MNAQSSCNNIEVGGMELAGSWSGMNGERRGMKTVRRPLKNKPQARIQVYTEVIYLQITKKISNKQNYYKKVKD